MLMEISMRPITTVEMVFIFILMFFSIPQSVLTLSNFTRLPLPLGVNGPEALAFDSSGGGPYTGVSDGRVLKYECRDSGFTEFAYTTPTRYAFSLNQNKGSP